MSRIGKKPIAIPAGVEVKIDGCTVTVKGPKATLTRDVHPNMAVKVEGAELIVERPNDQKQNRALHGLTRSLLANMVEGVSNGFSKVLEVNGVGYRAAVQGNTLNLTVGYCQRQQDHHLRRRQTEGRPVRCRSSREASAGTLQGQGHQVCRRTYPPQGR